jgi:hypothetical protein
MSINKKGKSKQQAALDERIKATFEKRGDAPLPHCPACKATISGPDFVGMFICLQAPMKSPIQHLLCRGCKDKVFNSVVEHRMARRLLKEPAKYQFPLAGVYPNDSMKCADVNEALTFVSNGASSWKEADSNWFKANPYRTIRLRDRFAGETFVGRVDPNDPAPFVLVRQLGPGVRVRRPVYSLELVDENTGEAKLNITSPIGCDEAMCDFLWELNDRRGWVPINEVMQLYAKHKLMAAVGEGVQHA